MANVVVKVKNSNIKKLFETMEYGKVPESTDLAEIWLKEHKSKFHANFENQDTSKMQGEEVKDVNSGNTLATVYNTPQGVVNALLQKALEKGNTWSSVRGIKRGQTLNRFASEIVQHSPLLCQLEVAARGILSKDTKIKAIPLLVDYIRYYSSWAVKHEEENPNWKPKGLVFVIVPNDVFLGSLGFVLGPALAAGYSVVIHTGSKLSPTVSLLMQLATNAGIPEGVLNLLPGKVDIQAIFKHEAVSVIANFDNVFKEVYSEIVTTLDKKYISLVPGKIPMVVFDSADLDSACDAVVDAAWGYQGLLPWSVDTIIVQENVMHTFVEKLKFRLSKVTMGQSNDKIADVSRPIKENAVQMLRKALEKAASLGVETFQPSESHLLFQPTLFIGGRVHGNNVIVPDEDLPVVTVLAFRTPAEAAALANNRRQGLAATVWTENIGLAYEISKLLQAANVWINTHGIFTADVPFTAQKLSGVGHIGGKEGFLEYVDFRFPQKPWKPAIKSNLPSEAAGHVLKSYYGGSFKKSESGLVNGVFDQPIGKDLHNAVSAAKKGHEVWSKGSTISRFRQLQQLADEIESNKETLITNCKVPETWINKWISTVYESIAQFDNSGLTNFQGLYTLTTYCDPIGVVLLEVENEIEKQPQKFIINTLLRGNSVIILERNGDSVLFYTELCKLLSLCSIPAGVFNILLNCNDDVIKTIAIHKEINCFITNTNHTVLNSIKIKDAKLIQAADETLNGFVQTAKYKNVWCNNRDSFA